MGRAEGAAAALELADGDGRGFGLAAFLLTLLLTQPEDLAVGHAAREVGNGIPPMAQTSGTVRPLGGAGPHPLLAGSANRGP
jgi:hypothetical protein